MNPCNVLLPGGINGDCSIPLSEVKNVLICDKDVSFSYANKNVLTNWTDLIKQDLTIYAIAALDSYDVTTSDPNIPEGAVSKAKTVTNDPLPSALLYLKSNACDFKEMLNTLKGGNYGIFYELQDGSILGAMDQSGTEIGYFKPFKCTIKASTKFYQEVDAVNAFRVYVGHTDINDVFNQFYYKPIWSTSELAEAMPVGLNLIATAVYSTGSQAVQINTRCAAGKTGVLVADFDESLDMSNVLVPAVTVAADAGGGAYTLTVQKGSSPANLVAGDYVTCRVKIVSGSDVTHLSNWLTVEGA